MGHAQKSHMTVSQYLNILIFEYLNITPPPLDLISPIDAHDLINPINTNVSGTTSRRYSYATVERLLAFLFSNIVLLIYNVEKQS